MGRIERIASRKIMAPRVVLAALLLLAACQTGAPPDVPQPGSGVVDLALPDGGLQRVLYLAPERPVAAIILLPGYDGWVTVDGAGHVTRGGSFLVRMRGAWLAQGFAIAVLHAPEPVTGMRSSAGYAETLRQVVAYVHTRTDAPIWLAGQSNGSVAAANGAAHMTHGEIAGLVLTSSVSRMAPGARETVFVAGLDRVTVPTLVVANADDDCVVTPPSDADAIRRGLTRAPKAEVMLFEGGGPPRSAPCMGQSPHGYLGIEARVVDGIAAWIKQQ